MTTYFVGGATGTFLAGTAWSVYGWNGVVAAGIFLTICSLIVNTSK